jgi:hypothetical protein
MLSLTLPSTPAARRLSIVVFAAVLLAFAGVALWAQVSGDRGIAPVASSTDIEVRGIEVNVTADNAEEARTKGWREAQRQAWQKLGGPTIPDGRLDSLVSAIVIEREQLGPRRYIATLGVVFDRARARELIGGSGERSRSAPMLTMPVLISGGTETMFEVRNPWQRAWAEFQAGVSAIDYVRPNGGGADSLLLTYGQAGRRSRVWWNDLLNQFGASDVVVPIARLRYSWPGGPVEGQFTARYGPDNRFLGAFALKAQTSAGVPAMLDLAVRRFDALFTQALTEGKLRPDPTLAMDGVQLSPQVLALIEASRRAEAEEAAARAGEQAPPKQQNGETPLTPSTPQPEQTQEASSFTVQVATPDAASVDTALASVRSAPGVRGVATSSIAIGGTSVLRVSFGGDIGALATALRGRGWQVNQGANALSITR